MTVHKVYFQVAYTVGFLKTHVGLGLGLVFIIGTDLKVL